MKLYSTNTGNFKLDGGAMFGVVPKSLWTRTNPADESNMISMAARCLLIENENRLILVDNGLGNKQSEKFFSFYFLYGDDSLNKSLARNGFTPDDITDVFLTHLHFDHCGGSINWNNDRTGYEPAFKNATYWSNGLHWKWATEPNLREKPSFLKENILPIQESGQLKFVEALGVKNIPEIAELFPEFYLLFAYGHTEAMMLPHISYKGKTVVFTADLVPTHGHIPVPYLMGYDVRPLLTMNEKENFLSKAADENYVLFLEHDPHIECCTVQHTEKGVRIKDSFTLEEYFGK